MPSVCFYFQVHQPYRIKNYGFFDIGLDHQIFDEEMLTKPVEIYGRTAFNTGTKKISKFLPIDTGTDYR